jgi:chitobiase/beta-hexosaminidase-like protein
MRKLLHSGGKPAYFARIVLAIALLCLPCYATNWFVTQAGAGSQNGTSLANAWSAANFNATSSPSAGDTVFFSGTFTTAISPGISGASGNQIILDGSGSCGGCSAATIPSINNSTHQWLDYTGITFSGTGTLFTCANSGAPQGVTVENTVYHGNASTGTATVVQLGFCGNFLFQNNVATGIASCVNNFQGSNNGPIVIRNNDCETSANTTDQSDVINLSDTRNVTIEGNLLINNAPGASVNSRHNDVMQTNQSGSSTNQCPENWIIRYNWIQPSPSGTDQSWSELEGFCGDPGLKIYGNVYVGRTTTWSGGNGLSVHTSNTGATYWFVNNTMYVHVAPLNALRLGEGDGAGTLTLFENNALGSDTNNCPGDCPQVTFTISKADNNFMQEWDQCSGTFSGTHGSCSTSLGFTNTTTNDFSLASGSALINAGDSTVGSEFNQGPCPTATWPNPTLCTRSVGNWDVGAFQTSGSLTPAATPTFSPVAGTYTGTQSVTISTTSMGAILCYNTTGSPATDGSTGCTTGTLYSGPVSVSASETLFAVAGGTGFTDSSVGSAAYTINAPATPSPAPWLF